MYALPSAEVLPLIIELEDDLLLKHQNKHCKKRHPREVSFIIDTNTNIAKGTTDPRIEFILPK